MSVMNLDDASHVIRFAERNDLTALNIRELVEGVAKVRDHAHALDDEVERERAR
jgi:hypothetical protein